jgi:UDP-N-acetylglucosamine 3-dehydrogenase
MGDDAILGVGVIGLGEIGQCHLHGYSQAPGVRITAVSDLDHELSWAASEQYGATAYMTYQELIDDPTVDVVSVCLPHVLHYEVLMRTIAAGKHILCEKPFTLTLVEADEVIEAADRAGVTIGLQHNQLFFGPHQRAHQLIEDGVIGPK